MLTFALGIGANTAMFSVVNGIILRPLGYSRPEQLMVLTTRVQGFEQFWVSSPEYFELTEINRSFSAIGAFRTGEANLAALDRPRSVTTAEVNVELLEALAVQPEHGRWFRRDETRMNGPAVVMVSHVLWQSAFAARQDIVGRAIEVNGVMREVGGVMPAGFDVMDNRIDVWQPLGVELTPARHAGYDAIRRDDGWRFQIKGRCMLPGCKPGQRLGSIDIDKEFDAVLMVLLDENLDATLWRYGLIRHLCRVFLL